MLLNVCTSKCNFAACGDLLYGIVVGIIATGGDIRKILLMLFIGLFGSIFFISTEVILRSISVWIGDTKTIANRYVEMLLITFSTYPENIFKIGIKFILYTVVPVAYLAYIPSSLMANFIAVGLVYFTVAVITFNKAMKNYESGNNLAMKN